tara:strand:+ start:3027 stop:3932 length:906 start_codon:yes stop_codon:yes gene_type:complete
MGKLTTKDLKDDNLKGTQWIGIVENTDDDIFEGRCRIRVFGKMDQREDPEDPSSAYIMPTESLPWARPSVASSGGSNSGSGTFSVPKLGTILRITFDNGNYYSPVYHESLYPSDETKAEIEAAYPNSHVLIYDTAFGLTGDLQSGNPEVTNEREGEHIKVFFTEEKGLMMDYTTTEGPTTVNIKPDNSVEIINANGDSIVMLNDGNITFTHSAQFTINSGANTEINCEDAIINCTNTVVNHASSIELGQGAVEKVVLGDTFMALFNKHTHIGNLGAPTSPPPATGNAMTAKELSQKQVKTL